MSSYSRDFGFMDEAPDEVAASPYSCIRPVAPDVRS